MAVNCLWQYPFAVVEIQFQANLLCLEFARHKHWQLGSMCLNCPSDSPGAMTQEGLLSHSLTKAHLHTKSGFMGPIYEFRGKFV